MLVPTLLAAAVLLVAPAAPGDGLGLLGSDGGGQRRPSLPVPAGPAPIPTAPVAPVVVAGVAGAVAATQRRRGGGPRTPGPRPVDPGSGGPAPVVVFVSGHGSDHLETFAELGDRLGLPPERVRHFDYRWALAGTADHVRASEDVPIGDVAIALNAYVAAVAAGGVPVYLVGHSKGGVAIAEMVAHWDETPATAVPGVIGATLLDPPMASGLLGVLQRLGGWVGPVPDNGGYDPITCDLLWRCRDRRDHLGEAAGVEVVVIRNPDAGITSFGDRPDGLRVLDLDDGGSHAVTRIWTSGSVVGRIVEAHTSVLHHPAVAACISEEMAEPGSCRWTGGPPPPPGRVGLGVGRSPNVLR